MQKRRVSVALVMFAALLPAAMSTAQELIPGKITVIKPGKIAKFVSKPTSGDFPLPMQDPTVSGATLRIFDTVTFPGGGAGDVTYSLPAGSWTGLGNPPGVKGFKYKGTGCKIVLIKPSVIKAVCKESVPFTTPFLGQVGITLAIPSGTSAAYCAAFGGEEKKNDIKLTKRKNAPPPAQCAQVQATPTATITRTATNTATITLTPTETLTPTATLTASVTPTVTATRTVTLMPTPTSTPVPTCPLTAGKYTVTQVAGGSLKVYTFMPFPFPAGGSIVQDVAAASQPACVHSTVVPFPGGFSAPNFCVPALGYTVSVTQTGCGAGRIDSNGGSDYTILEVSDTSNTGAPCFLPHTACAPGADASVRVDITVGNGAADTCSGGGTANAIVTIPVHTVTWQDNSAGTFGSCPGDGVFNGGDAIITQFDQVLDFTTDQASHHWADIDGDLCSLAGGGPAAGQPAQTGVCQNLMAGTVTTVAAGGFGSTGIPNDGSFSTKLPNTFALSGAFAGDTCGSPPVINFTGLATRCIP